MFLTTFNNKLRFYGQELHSNTHKELELDMGNVSVKWKELEQPSQVNLEQGNHISLSADEDDISIFCGKV